MANFAPAPNKSDRVRQYLAKKPTASVHQIVADLEPHGVSESLAAKIKYKETRETATTERVRRSETARPAADSAATHGGKAKAVREVAKSLPRPIRAVDVRTALAARGIDVSFAHVAQVLRNMGMKRKRRRKTAAGSAAPVAATHSAQLSIDDLVAAKKLVAQVGSIEKVKEALAALARLS